MGAPENHAVEPRRVRAEDCERKGKRYHIYHPYQVAMNSGKLTKEQIQGWVCNRYLLSDQHPDQGRGHTVQHAGPRPSTHVDPAHPRPRRHAR